MRARAGVLRAALWFSTLTLSVATTLSKRLSVAPKVARWLLTSSSAESMLVMTLAMALASEPLPIDDAEAVGTSASNAANAACARLPYKVAPPVELPPEPLVPAVPALPPVLPSLLLELHAATPSEKQTRTSSCDFMIVSPSRWAGLRVQWIRSRSRSCQRDAQHACRPCWHARLSVRVRTELAKASCERAQIMPRKISKHPSGDRPSK